MANHPIQPLQKDEDGRIWFKKNPIVEYLLETHPDLDLNKLTTIGCGGKFSNDDWTQFTQLIGYSFDGWKFLSCVSDKAFDRAEKEKDKFEKEEDNG